MSNKKRKGFTLIELIVVIAIIGILAAITLPRLSDYTDSANTARLEASAHTAATGATAYLVDNGFSKADLELTGRNLSADDLAPYMNDTIKVVSGVGAPNTNKWGHFQWSSYTGEDKKELMCVHVLAPSYDANGDGDYTDPGDYDGGSYKGAGIDYDVTQPTIIVEMYDPTVDKQYNSSSEENIRYFIY